ncbi:MAG: hypothetical protein WD595_00110 [Waddliaceae bacterium]
MAIHLSDSGSPDNGPRSFGELLMWISNRDVVIQEVSSKAFQSLIASSALVLSGTVILLGGKHNQNKGLQFHGKFTIGLGVFNLVYDVVQCCKMMSKVQIK